MKKNNGFTLIELLATIIILAGVALVTFPILLNTIKNSENKIDRTTRKLVENAAKLYVDNNLNEYPKTNGRTYCLSFDNLIENNYLEKGILEAAEVDISEKTVKITVGGNYNYQIVDNEQCKYDAYENGAVIYYDIGTGKKCNNYHIDNSITGYNGYTNKKFNSSTKQYDNISIARTSNQNTCLKFYAFNDSTDLNKLKLLLDHNTTGMIPWNSSKNNLDGMNEVKTKLYEDTKDWNGTETPILFDDIDLTTQNKIDYTGYKARLITAAEVARITGKNSFDSNSNICYDFETLEDAILNNPIDSNLERGQAKYAWLFDYTRDCIFAIRDGEEIKSGCNFDVPNSSSDYNWGYWTSTVINNKDYLNYAWAVEWDGAECISEIENKEDDGVRPVIEVLKSNL